ncbi:MAG TPA: hypothetical protein VGW38_01260 [Chloroflexota bacterium]|nr:hypothetical protein [Chloroflexota bacterium]
MTDGKQNNNVKASDDETDYPRHTPGQAEGEVEDVEGGGDHKDEINPKKPSQAEGAPEDTEEKG